MRCDKCGNCNASANPCMGCQGIHTLPRDEWEEMTRAERKAARAKGISPEALPSPVDKECPTYYYER